MEDGGDTPSAIPSKMPYSGEQALAESGDEPVEYMCQFVHHLLDFRQPEVEALAGLAGVSDDQLSWRRPHGGSEFSPFWYLRVPPKAIKPIAARALLTKVTDPNNAYSAHCFCPPHATGACLLSSLYMQTSHIACTHPPVFCQGFFEVWGEGADWAELQASVEAYPAARKDPWFSKDVTFRIVVDTFGVKLKDKEHVELIERLEPFLPFEVSGSQALPRVC